MNFFWESPRNPRSQARNTQNEILHVPRTVLEKVHCCMFLRTILEKVSSFDAPARLGTKGADLSGISNSNLPFSVNQSFLVQKQNYKLASWKLTKRQVGAIETCLCPLAIDSPIRPLSNIWMIHVTLVNESCHIINRSYHRYRWVMSRVYICHTQTHRHTDERPSSTAVARTSQSYRSHEWVTSHIYTCTI